MTLYTLKLTTNHALINNNLITSVSDFKEIDESPLMTFLDLSSIEGVGAGLGLLELRLTGVLCVPTSRVFFSKNIFTNKLASFLI